MSDFLIEAGQRLLFIGDSNTDTEYRTRAAPIGYGYVMMFHSLLESSRPGLGIEVINRGNDGDTILDIERRWHSDVIELNPDWLFIMIGSCDVWANEATGDTDPVVDEVTFERVLRRLIEQTQAQSRARIVLIEPPAFDLPVDSTANRRVASLCTVLAKVGRELGCGTVPVYESMARAIADGHSEGWYQNFNHPAFPGHAHIAQQVLRHVGWVF